MSAAWSSSRLRRPLVWRATPLSGRDIPSILEDAVNADHASSCSLANWWPWLSVRFAGIGNQDCWTSFVKSRSPCDQIQELPNCCRLMIVQSSTQAWEHEVVIMPRLKATTVG